MGFLFGLLSLQLAFFQRIWQAFLEAADQWSAIPLLICCNTRLTQLRRLSFQFQLKPSLPHYALLMRKNVPSLAPTFIRAKRVSNWYTPQKKSARLPACTCQKILVLVFTYVSTTYVRTSARYQPAIKIRICIYVCARVGYVLCATYVRKLV